MSTKSPGRTLTVKTKITNNTLRKHLAESMREKHKRQIIRDTELAGFNLVVNRTNVGTWNLDYRPKGRQPDGPRWPYRIKKIGRTSEMSVDQARTEANRQKVALNEGRDPYQEKIERRKQEEAKKQKRKLLTDTLDSYTDYVDRRTDIKDSYRKSEKLYARKAVDLTRLLQ